MEVCWTCRSGSISERLMGTSFVRLWTCKTGLISERLTRDPLGRLWMCKTGSISERLTRDPLGRPWTCKTGSIFECLIRTPLGRLLDMQNWFNIRTSDRDPSWTSSGHAKRVQYLYFCPEAILDVCGHAKLFQYLNVSLGTLMDVCGCAILLIVILIQHPCVLSPLLFSMYTNDCTSILTPLSSSKLTDDITLSFRTVTSLLTNRISKSWLSGAVATTRS